MSCVEPRTTRPISSPPPAATRTLSRVFESFLRCLLPVLCPRLALCLCTYCAQCYSLLAPPYTYIWLVYGTLCVYDIMYSTSRFAGCVFWCYRPSQPAGESGYASRNLWRADYGQIKAHHVRFPTQPPLSPCTTCARKGTCVGTHCEWSATSTATYRSVCSSPRSNMLANTPKFHRVIHGIIKRRG